jgi:lysophospholipase L1-like esterase
VNLPDRDPSFLPRTVLFNEAIAEAVSLCGENFFVADLFHSRLNNDFYYVNTLDGLHPDEDGMGLIAETVEAALRKHIP